MFLSITIISCFDTSKILIQKRILSEHEIIADAAFISTVDVVVEQLWKYSVIQINMKNDLKTAENECKS